MTAIAEALQPTGSLSVQALRPPPRPVGKLTIRELAHHGLPHAGLPAHVNAWKARQAPEFLSGLRRVAIARRMARRHGLFAPLGFLWLRKIDGHSGLVDDYGLVSAKIVVTDHCNYIVETYKATGSYVLANFKFHGIGTGATAAVVGDRALQTELTTQYSTDNVRPTGSQITGDFPREYRTVGTVTVDATVAATEWGLFTQAATGAQSQPANSMADRVVYSVVNLASGDSLQATFDLLFPDGG